MEYGTVLYIVGYNAGAVLCEMEELNCPVNLKIKHFSNPMVEIKSKILTFNFTN